MTDLPVCFVHPRISALPHKSFIMSNWRHGHYTRAAAKRIKRCHVGHESVWKDLFHREILLDDFVKGLKVERQSMMDFDESAFQALHWEVFDFAPWYARISMNYHAQRCDIAKANFVYEMLQKNPVVCQSHKFLKCLK